MLTRVDRIQVAVRDRAAAAQTFMNIFGASEVEDGVVAALGALRRTVRAGSAEFELLEPYGDGAVARFLEQRRRGGLFSAGFSTPDLQALAGRFDAMGVRYATDGERLLLDETETRGMRAIISSERPAASQPSDIISHLYEVTNVVRDWQEAEDRYVQLFGLDRTRFSPIHSSSFGYGGVLTLFDPPAKLDRIEITQTDASGAMDSFFQRYGDSLYMCFVETDDLERLRSRLEAHEARWAGAPEEGNGSLFIHPSGAEGVLIGVSRNTFAWTWSGRPELAVSR
jgi:catechol 2,3-dioxygenase-like lactoylglutathione lyase family enzyme